MSDESATTKQLDAALLAAQKEIDSIGKDSANSFHKYLYVSSDHMSSVCRVALHNNGLKLSNAGDTTLHTLKHSIVWQATREDAPEIRDWETVVVRRGMELSHPESGERRVYNLDFPAAPEKGRPIDKAVAGALTTSLNYFLRDLLLVPRVDENDMNNRKDEPQAPSKREVAKPAVKAGTTKADMSADLLKQRAKEWANGNAEDARPAGLKALSLVIKGYVEGKTKIKQADIEAAIQLVRVAIEAQKWAGTKNLDRSIELLDLAKFAVMKEHEGYVLTPEEADTVIAYMDSVPFSETTTEKE